MRHRDRWKVGESLAGATEILGPKREYASCRARYDDNDVGTITWAKQKLAGVEVEVVSAGVYTALNDGGIQQSSLSTDPHDRDLNPGVVGEAQAEETDCGRITDPQPKWLASVDGKRRRAGCQCPRCRRRSAATADVLAVGQDRLSFILPTSAI